MIKRVPRDNTDKYNLIITDKNNNSFTMMVGGNLDLYWVPDNYKENNLFEIDKDDELLFSIFNQLFDVVKKRDDKYNPVLDGNIITFISEEWALEESNILKIRKDDDSINIEFIKNENKNPFSIPHRGCPICFCNSGSRVPRIEQLFMKMFTYLAYECDMIPTEDPHTM